MTRTPYDDEPWDDEPEPTCGYCHKPGHTADECPEDEGDGLTDAERWGDL